MVLLTTRIVVVVILVDIDLWCRFGCGAWCRSSQPSAWAANQASRRTQIDFHLCEALLLHRNSMPEGWVGSVRGIVNGCTVHGVEPLLSSGGEDTALRGHDQQPSG